MSARDGAERLLDLMTAGLPAYRAEWGEAMRSELASIDDPDARRQFARSAARAAFGRGVGMTIGFGVGVGLLVATLVLAASRLQMADGGPGLLDVTVPVPAFILLLVTLLSAALTRSFRFGLVAGALALATSLAALFTVLATEGIVWMNRHGVFLLDGDPPRGAVDTTDIVFNLFTTGMWVGHLVLWVPAVLVGTALGAWIGSRRSPADLHAVPVPSQDG